jgi:chromate transporter
VGDLIALAKTIPGAGGTNMAAYAAFLTAGIGGVLTGVTALMIPTIMVDLAVSVFMRHKKATAQMEKFMEFLRPVSAGLILSSVLSMLQTALTHGAFRGFSSILSYLDIKSLGLYAALLLVCCTKQGKKLHPLFILAAGAAAGVGLRL